MIRAFFASIIATAIVSALIYVNVLFGFPVELDILAEIAEFNSRIGLPETERARWATHLIIGVLFYGIAFWLLEPILPGGNVAEGLVFGLIAWLAMMLVFMPLAGHALFAQTDSAVFIAATFGLHVIYGGVLGISYAAMGDPRD